MPLYLAYDGSINADWVARYAICLARYLPGRQLHVVHVKTGEPPDDQLQRKLGGVEQDGRAAEVAVAIETIPVRGTVAATLADVIPTGSDVFVMCGTRVRGGRRGYLSGTVAEKLLGRRANNVMAMRVVQPGLLGVAHDILFAIVGSRALFRPSPPFRLGPPARPGLSFLDLVAPEIQRLHILNAVKLRRAAYRHLTARRLSKLRREGFLQAQDVEQAVMERTGLTDRMIDSSVRVTDDWVMETLILASRHKSQLICLQVPPRSLIGTFPFANPIERMLRDTPCDVALISSARGLD